MKKSKRILAGVMAVCLMGGVTVIPENIAPAVSMTVSAESTKGTYEQLTYENYGDYIEITECTSTIGVVIPSEINGVPVTSIAKSAFSSCRLTSVVIPDSVTNIGEGAFQYCSELKSVTLSKNIKQIQPSTFCQCSKLTSINIPDGVTDIGKDAFYWCANLESVVIPDSVTSIDSEVFSDTQWLKYKQEENPLVIVNNIVIDGKKCSGDVVIPDGITSISGCAFRENSNLTSIVIPESIMSIGDKAFYYCRKLTSIGEPTNISNIGRTAFDETPWIKEKKSTNNFVTFGGILIYSAVNSGNVTIPEGVTGLCDWVFSSSSNLLSITLPNSIKSIGKSAFYDCSKLNSITIPEGCESIGEQAFYYCVKLKEIKLPNSIKYIENYAFEFCGITSIEIPDNVTSIEDYTFAFSDLQSAVISENVTKIGKGAFSTCSQLTSITILNPKCDIYNADFTFTNNIMCDFKGTIYGYTPSTAQEYALIHGRNFVSLGEAPEKETALGDVSGDGLIDAVDATNVLIEYSRLSTGGDSTFTELQKKSADVNGDGLIDAVDSTFILSYYAHVSTGGTMKLPDFISSLSE